MKRVLGIDPGDVRCGAAISDPLGSFAIPLEIIPTRSALVRIAELVEEYDVRTVVVGLPKTLRGEIGHQAKRAEKFIALLKEHLPEVNVETIDERLSSSEADRFIQTKKGKKMRDAVAAALLVDTWMKRQKR